VLGGGMINSIQMFEVGYIQGVLAPYGRAITTAATTEGTLDQCGMTQESDMRIIYKKFHLDT
jgi:hypothetical protein